MPLLLNRNIRSTTLRDFAALTISLIMVRLQKAKFNKPDLLLVCTIILSCISGSSLLYDAICYARHVYWPQTFTEVQPEAGTENDEFFPMLDAKNQIV